MISYQSFQGPSSGQSLSIVRFCPCTLTHRSHLRRGCRMNVWHWDSSCRSWKHSSSLHFSYHLKSVCYLLASFWLSHSQLLNRSSGNSTDLTPWVNWCSCTWWTQGKDYLFSRSWPPPMACARKQGSSGMESEPCQQSQYLVDCLVKIAKSFYLVYLRTI